MADPRPYQQTPADALQDMYEQAWAHRSVATTTILACTEELIARTVTENVPAAVALVLHEDTSHTPHRARVAHILDESGVVLLSGGGQEWRDAHWTGEVEEWVFDLYALDPARFTGPTAEHGNGRRNRPATIPRSYHVPLT
jgi:hypothetical protein